MLKVQDLVVAYGSAVAVHGVSFGVGQDEFVSIIGANGAGKTTTMRALSGLIPPKAGTVEFEGRRVSGLPGHRITRLGIVQCPEGRRVWGKMTVRENLLVGGQSQSKSFAAKELERMFEVFPILAQRQDQLAGTLSGGEQQMLALARAMMAKPKLLLLDEPSLGLAPKVVSDIGRLLKGLKGQGLAVLLVEQNARLALGVSDRCYVMEQGRIVQSGTAEELRNDASVREAYLGQANRARKVEQAR